MPRRTPHSSSIRHAAHGCAVFLALVLAAGGTARGQPPAAVRTGAPAPAAAIPEAAMAVAFDDPRCGVALVLPLTGPRARLGLRVATVVEDVLGAAGVTVVRYDDRGEAAGAAEALARADESGCALVVGGLGDQETRAVVAAAVERGLPLVDLGSAPGRSIRPGVLRARSGRDEAVALLARRLADEGVKAAHVLAVGTRWGREQAESFRVALAAAGSRVVSLRVAGPADGDARALVKTFVAQVAAARGDDPCVPEALFLAADAVMATRWLGFLEAEAVAGVPSGEGCPPPVVAGTSAWNDPAVLLRHGAALEGARLGDLTAAGEEGGPAALEAEAADGARLAVAAWKAAGGGTKAPARDALRAALGNGLAVAGQTGDLKTQAGRVVGRALATFTLRAGRPVPDPAPEAGRVGEP